MDFLCQFPGMKPTRQVITRSPHRSVGSIHASWFQDSPIHHESDLEAAVIKVLLLAPTVRHIQHQPVTLPYFDGERERKHYPDLGLTLCDGPKAIVEVKPAKFVPEHEVKFNACAALLRPKDMDYYVCTDEHVTEDRRYRALAIHDHAKMAAPAADLAALVDWVRSLRQVSVQDALARGHSEPLICHAVGRRLLLTDPSLELAPGNWLTTQETADELICIDRWLGCSPWPDSRHAHSSD